MARPYQRAPEDPQLIKRAVNAWIAACAAALHSATAAGGDNSAPWALVLESRHLLTLGALRTAGCGVRAETTVVPNPDPVELAAIVAAEPSLLALPLSSHELLGRCLALDPGAAHPARAALEARGWPGGFAVVWLDYCGTVGAGERDDAIFSSHIAY